jgi:sterol desaturase/sphingolipid hydroxylase (fatty acid hydroxylase superfamily)
MIAAIAIVSCALVILVLERVCPYDRQRLLREGLGIDLIGYALIQSIVLAFVIRGFVGWLDGVTGASARGLVAGWPAWAQLGLFVITHDLYIYWFHRLQHRNRYLWRIHEAHHSAREIDWIAGSRSHALEITINQTIELGAMVLLGASQDVILAKGAISVIWGMWIHSNIDVRSGRLQRILNGPEMHRWHHSIDNYPAVRNFATKLAIWDFWFGTASQSLTRPRGYGLSAEFPRSFFGQQAHAFRRECVDA